MQTIESTEDVENFMLKHGANIVDTLGGEVDRIEKNLKVLFYRILFVHSCIFLVLD